VAERPLARVVAIMLALAATWLFPGVCAAFENNINRVGGDYKSFDLSPSVNTPYPCAMACKMDPNCRAWTFVRPGIQGPTARCWLKNVRTKGVSDTCCVSGVQRTNKGCVVAGVMRKDIADEDCVEAQGTGCIRRLLTPAQYAACLRAQKPYHKIVNPPKNGSNAGNVATAIATNTVYKQPNGDDSASNKVCAMRAGDTATVVKRGPSSWVQLSNISGGCGGKSGYVWNEGELRLP
jgi:hypothetical protein